jgi:CHASE3 domain sensor protein
MLKVNSYSKLIIVGSILPVIAFGIVGYLSYVNISNQLVDESWVNHTQLVINKCDSMLITMLNAETSTRGYVLTKNDTYLEPYNLAVSTTDNNLNELKLAKR